MGGGGGGLGSDIKFEASQVHQRRGKLGKFCYHQNVGKNPNFGLISKIQKAKFGVLVPCILVGKICGSDKNFRRKFWGQDPLPHNMEVPPLCQNRKFFLYFKS